MVRSIMVIQSLPRWYRALARWMFLPGLAVVVWGELKPSTHGAEVIWDKFLHFTAYSGLAGMAAVALGGQLRRAMWAALALALFGGILEIVQGFVGRDAEWADELANILGVCVGTAAALASLWVMERLVSGSRERGEADEILR